MQLYFVLSLGAKTIAECSQKRILAIDGGGTKTLCWIATPTENSLNVLNKDFDWKVLGRGNSGPSNPRSIGFELAFKHLEIAIEQALEQYKLAVSFQGHPTFDVACFSLAGVGRTEEQNRVRAWAVERQWARQIIVTDDISPLRFAAHHETRILSDSFSHSEETYWNRSITLVVGTGAIAVGCDESGNLARSDGWGYLLGDQGSGYAIGLSALQSICESHDQGLELSVFHRTILTELKLDSAQQLIAWTYREAIPRDSIAELARTVIHFAGKDLIANAILDSAIKSMAKSIANVANRLRFSGSDYALALSGGILRNNPALVDRLKGALATMQIAPRIVHIVQEPILGALALASQSC